MPAVRDLTDKAITSTMCSFDELRGLWIVIKCIAQLTNGNFEDGVSHKSFGPNVSEKFFFGNELAWPADKLVEHCEGFGSELNYL